MRRITLWVMSTIAAVVLLFSYRTSTGAVAGSSASTPITTDSGSSAGANGSGSAGSSGASGSSGSSGSGSKTYSGSTAQTRWGPVQVKITVSGGKITGVAVPTYPNGNGRDAEINATALPALVQETMSAQSADIDGISGATVTSDGYKQSLQAAIDAAHL